MLRANKSMVPLGKSWSARAISDFRINRAVYLMILPALVYFIIFHYGPMYGAQIAFKNYAAGKGIWGSPWVGVKYFAQFFRSHFFFRLVRNTLVLNFYQVLFGFPAPIILALLLNELKRNTFKRTVQTITYLPYFISLVVICGMIVDLTVSDGDQGSGFSQCPRGCRVSQ